LTGTTVVKIEQISGQAQVTESCAYCVRIVIIIYNIVRLYIHRLHVFYTYYIYIYVCLILTRALITRRIKVKLTHDTSQPFRGQDGGHLLSNTPSTHPSTNTPFITAGTLGPVRPLDERFRQTINRLGNTTFSRRPLDLHLFIHDLFVSLFGARMTTHILILLCRLCRSNSLRIRNTKYCLSLCMICIIYRLKYYYCHRLYR